MKPTWGPTGSLLLAIAIATAGCDRHRTAAAPPATAERGARRAAAERPLVEQLAAEQQALAVAIDDATLEQVHVRAYRIRELAGTIADHTTGLAAAQERELRAGAARIAELGRKLEDAGNRGDRGAAHVLEPELTGAIVTFTTLVAQGEVGPVAEAMGSRDVLLRGEIIDPQCYFTHDSRGLEHASCARMCAKGGQDMAFLDEASGRIWPLIAAGHGRNPNDGLLDHIGKPVEVEGVVFARGANEVLLIHKVSPLGKDS